MKAIERTSASSSSLIHMLKAICTIAWFLSKDDLETFVFPNTLFGLCTALVGSDLVSHSSSRHEIIRRIPHVILFNWTNVIIFELANQRLPCSVKEDSLNKPWRVIPSGRLAPHNLRQALLFLIPVVLAINHFYLGVGSECALLTIISWLYNDLEGGETWATRDCLLAVVAGLCNIGSTKVISYTTASTPVVSTLGWIWVAIISGITWTTMTVQDLKDVVGDRARRNRRTAPLVFGTMEVRWYLAIMITLWSYICSWFWQSKLAGLIVVAYGVYIAWRCIKCDGYGPDRRTYEHWALWQVVLFTLPCLAL